MAPRRGISTPPGAETDPGRGLARTRRSDEKQLPPRFEAPRPQALLVPIFFQDTKQPLSHARLEHHLVQPYVRIGNSEDACELAARGDDWRRFLPFDRRGLRLVDQRPEILRELPVPLTRGMSRHLHGYRVEATFVPLRVASQERFQLLGRRHGWPRSYPNFVPSRVEKAPRVANERPVLSMWSAGPQRDPGGNDRRDPGGGKQSWDAWTRLIALLVAGQGPDSGPSARSLRLLG